jgi:hypothetical protein
MNGEQLAAAIEIAERYKAEASAEIAALDTREQSYPVARLRRHPEILGVGRAELAAALADGNVSDSAALTRAQAADLIERSQSRIVQTEEA